MLFFRTFVQVDKSVSSVIIPESVTTIGCGAFYGCKAVTTLNIGDKLEIFDMNGKLISVNFATGTEN